MDLFSCSVVCTVRVSSRLGTLPVGALPVGTLPVFLILLQTLLVLLLNLLLGGGAINVPESREWSVAVGSDWAWRSVNGVWKRSHTGSLEWRSPKRFGKSFRINGLRHSSEAHMMPVFASMADHRTALMPDSACR
jgi:hypothetical protein